MQIKDIMTKEVVFVNQEDTIEKAAQLMKDYNVGSIPVCDGQKIVGIVTDRDITLRCVSQGKDVKQVVSDVMTNNPVTAHPLTDVQEAARMMSDQQVRRLPITDHNNLVGIVALGDLAVDPKSKNNAGNALKDISVPSNPSVS